MFDVSNPANIVAKGVTSNGLFIPRGVVVAGKHAYIANANGGPSVGGLAVFQLSHLETPTIQTGSLQTGYLDVTDNAVLNNDLGVHGGLNVGPNGDRIDGALAVNAADNYFAGDTGIGTSSPTNRLHVQDSINGQATVQNHVVLIENSSTGTSADVPVLKVGAAKANTTHFMRFISIKDGNNVDIGGIEGNDSGGIRLFGTGADYAEYLMR